MAEDSSSSSASPTRLSGVSGSSPGSVVAGTPLEVKEVVFRRMFEAALGFKILLYTDLQNFPPDRVLELLAQDGDNGRERVANIVNAIIGTDRKVVLKRFDTKRYGEDIRVVVEDSPELAERFFNLVGIDFYQDKMTPLEIYNLVMGTAWMIKSSATNRGFAAQLCEILVENEAFGTRVETLHAIEKAIGLDILFSDKTPEALRIKMISAVNKGCRKFGGNYICEYLFEEQLGGVPFVELAKHLPLDVMGHPFAVYISRTGILKTDADKDSVLPPPAEPSQDDPRTILFGTPTRIMPPPLPVVPRPGGGTPTST